MARWQDLESDLNFALKRLRSPTINNNNISVSVTLNIASYPEIGEVKIRLSRELLGGTNCTNILWQADIISLDKSYRCGVFYTFFIGSETTDSFILTGAKIIEELNNWLAVCLNKIWEEKAKDPILQTITKLRKEIESVSKPLTV